ncbi:MAG: hypothetical protein EAZ20_16105, partial [Bacteroidetes bacterium]
IYSIINSVGEQNQSTTLPQPKRSNPKTISTKEGSKTLAEILEMAMKQREETEKKVILYPNPSTSVVNYEPKSQELVSYDAKNYEITSYETKNYDSFKRENKTKTKNKKFKKYEKSHVEVYRNTNSSSLKFEKEDLKKAFILSEILQRKY